MGFLSRLFGTERTAKPTVKVTVTFDAPSNNPPKPSGKPLDASAWASTPALLEFLAEFSKIRDPQKIFPNNWILVLHEYPTQTAARLAAAGVLVPSQLDECLEATLNVSELKQELKRRGLPVSGRKALLVGRLVDAGEDEARALVGGQTFLTIAGPAKPVLEKFQSTNALRLETAIDRSMQKALASDYKGAIEDLKTFNKTKVFPRYEPRDSDDHQRFVTKLMLTATVRPKILARLPERYWPQLRRAALQWALWGNAGEAPSDFSDATLSWDVALRMIWFHIRHLEELAQHENIGVKKWTILNCGPESCEHCQRLSDTIFTRRSLPELPYERCTNQMGCRCGLTPEISGLIDDF